MSWSFLRRPLGALLAFMGAAVLSGCGGGALQDNGGVFVSSMGATTASYGRTMTVVLSGSGFSKGVNVTLDSGCGAVTEVSGGTDQSRSFSCKVNALGTLTARALTTKGLEVGRLQITIPQPEVTLLVTGASATMQTLVMQLDPAKAPISVMNFLDYVNAGFYRGTIFHRVIKDFVIQAGGYTSGPVVKVPTSPAITLESNNGLSNLRGTVAMARTTDFNSATSQFYINTVDNTSLDYKSATDPGYAVFGKVITGLDVVDSIAGVATRFDLGSGLMNLPVSDVVIALAQQTK
jgi:cyclophilin family peptidyl-prolyl cis-trans isomerase